MEKKYSTYLSINLLKTFGISAFTTLLVNQIINGISTRNFEEKQGDFIESIALLFWILMLTISVITVYFNLIERIRNNTILRLLSFFLTPFIISILVRAFGDRNGDWLTFYTSTFIFFTTHLFFYIKFKRAKLYSQ